MPSASRWLNWKPENANTPALTTDRTARTARSGPSLVQSGSSVSLSVTPISENRVVIQEPSFWADDFGRWALECCLFRDRCFGGVKALHNHFCDWCNAQGPPGCMLETFEALLEDEGFLLAGGLVSGLVLREDWETVHAPPSPPEPPAKARAAVMVGGHRWTP